MFNSQYFDSVMKYCFLQIIYIGTSQCLTEQQLIIYVILLKIFLRVYFKLLGLQIYLTLNLKAYIKAKYCNILKIFKDAKRL